MMTFTCRTESETEAAGREIAGTLSPKATLHLTADLGAGKTFLARALATELGADPLELTSPTFAIVHEYLPRPGAPIITIDAYGMTNNRRQLLEIGLVEL